MERRRPLPSLVLPPNSGYRDLVAFQVAELLYHVTVRFVDKYIPAGSRTRDQMEQAARSGVRNTAEGSVLSATSKKLEMNLTNVARGSVDELKNDYKDFLKQRELPLWDKDDPRRRELVDLRCKDADEVARWCRAVWLREKEARMAAPPTDTTNRTPRTVRGRAYAEISANAGHTLSGVACNLLDRLVNAQARAFEKEGGFSERLYRVRKKAREEKEEEERRKRRAG